MEILYGIALVCAGFIMISATIGGIALLFMLIRVLWSLAKDII